MSQDRPSVIDLIRTVRDFIGTLRPQLEGEAHYGALVSSYLLGIVERELTAPAELDDREREQLAELLGSSKSLTELHQAFCERIRNGEFDDKWNAALEITLAQIVNKVRIVRPDYLDRIHSDEKIK